MFTKLSQINFETLRSLSFATPKYQNDFFEYFKIAEKIYNLYSELEEFESILSDNDKKIIQTDIITFSEILLNIQNQEWKKPDDRLRKDKFSNNYINSLTQTKIRYTHFANLLNKNINSYTQEKLNLENSHKTTIQSKESINTELLENIKRIEESKKVELEEKSEEINKISADKSFLEDEKKKLELELKKKELNKLAEAFKVEEDKYSN